MKDYSHMSDKDLAETIVNYRKLLLLDFRIGDEVLDSAGVERAVEIRNDLHEMEKTARNRGITEADIYNAERNIFNRERMYGSIFRENNYREQTLQNMAYAVVNNNLFESEEFALNDDYLKEIVQARANRIAEERLKDHEIEKRRDRSAILSMIGKTRNLRGAELGVLPVIGRNGYIEYKYMNRKPYGEYEPEILKTDYEEANEIVRNLYWTDGISAAVEYSKAVRFLGEKARRGEEHEVKLAGLLDFNKAALIGRSFRSPTFIQWFYKRELPAFSWSMRDGEPMMKALTTGEYKKSYENEINLIERTVREIGERYG